MSLSPDQSFTAPGINNTYNTTLSHFAIMTFATYVFVELGTTDIQLHPIGIVNLSMIAVRRKSLQKIENQPKYDISTGSLYESEQYWTRGEFTLDMIVSFLEELAKPICLIAHNGLRFDFPLLKQHVFQHEVEFFEDVMCVDSMHFFYDILNPYNEKSSNADRVRGSFPWPDYSRSEDHYDLRRLYKRVMGYYDQFVNAHERNMAVVELVVALAEHGFSRWVKWNHYPCLEVPWEVHA